MKKILIISTTLFIMLASANAVFAQVKIGTNPTTIDDGSILEVESTNKGFVPPRMTTAQMNAIPTPLLGSVVYNTDINCLHQYTTTGWNSLCDLTPDVYSVIGTDLLAIPNQGSADVPGVTQTITIPAGQTRIALITVTGYAVTNFDNGAPNEGQGVFELHQNNTKISSAYAHWVSGNTLAKLPLATTFQRTVTLTAGTYTFKVRYAAWSGNTYVNYDPTNYAGYNGDDESMKTRMSILVMPL